MLSNLFDLGLPQLGVPLLFHTSKSENLTYNLREKANPRRNITTNNFARLTETKRNERKPEIQKNQLLHLFRQTNAGSSHRRCKVH